MNDWELQGVDPRVQVHCLRGSDKTGVCPHACRGIL